MDVIKVLLVDDHALFRSGVASLLGRQVDFKVVGEAHDGPEALKKAKELTPDIILMDVNMPGGGGLEATRRIKEDLPDVKIVMLTVSDEDNDLFEAIKAGAHGYVLKNVRPEMLLTMLRGVSSGEAPISQACATRLLGEFAQLARRLEEARPLERLTLREQEVLNLLSKGATNKEIASSLGISENTVKNHMKNILEKLHLENRVQAATYALRKNSVHDRK